MADDIPDEVWIEASQTSEDADRKRRPTRKSTRFGKPQTSEQVTELKEAGVPVNTKRCTSWASTVWSSWATERKRKIIEDAEKNFPIQDNFSSMSLESLSFWLPKFIIEARKANGDHYPPGSLYSLCCGLQRDLREKEIVDINIFQQSQFTKFRQVLDSEMKRLNSTGKFTKKSSDIITEEMEDKLWQLKILGDHSPQALINTVFYYIGLYFALRGGDEHRRLRHNPAQIIVNEESGKAYISYTEDVSKTNQGGLLNRHRSPKVVVHYENTENPERCLVRLFKLYIHKCPVDRPDGAFYLKPLSNPKTDVWFQKIALGHNTLSSMISRMMSSAKIVGHFTNHSLRSSASTRLFNAHTDEQLIMARTGHSSTKGVRCYKKISEQLMEETSAVLNGKRRKCEEEKENDIPILPSSSSTSETSFPAINVASSSNITFNISIAK